MSCFQKYLNSKISQQKPHTDNSQMGQIPNQGSKLQSLKGNVAEHSSVKRKPGRPAVSLCSQPPGHSPAGAERPQRSADPSESGELHGSLSDISIHLLHIWKSGHTAALLQKPERGVVSQAPAVPSKVAGPNFHKEFLSNSRTGAGRGQPAPGSQAALGLRTDPGSCLGVQARDRHSTPLAGAPFAVEGRAMAPGSPWCVPAESFSRSLSPEEQGVFQKPRP